MFIFNQACLEKAVVHANEIMRRIKAAQYVIDLDLEHKEYTASIDRDGANLKPCQLSLVTSKIRNFCNLDMAYVTNRSIVNVTQITIYFN